MEQPPKPSVTRLDYCQYLLGSQVNYTLTHFAEHAERFSHDATNRYLAGDRLPPRLVWEHVREQVVGTDDGYVVFDDTVLDKRHADTPRSLASCPYGPVCPTCRGLLVHSLSPPLHERAR